MASEDLGVSWSDLHRWPYSYNLWHQWLPNFLKHQKILNFHSKFQTLKVLSSHLVVTRGTSVGSVEDPWLASKEELVTFLSTHKIITWTGHELYHPHCTHFNCCFSHRLSIERVKDQSSPINKVLVMVWWDTCHWQPISSVNLDINCIMYYEPKPNQKQKLKLEKWK